MVGRCHSSRQLQIVFLRDFVQLVHHLLGVDIVGVIFFRRLEFSLGGHVDGVVGVVALAEFIPLLGGLLLRGILQALEGQNCFCDLRCLVSFPIGVNPGRGRGFVFVQLQLLRAEGSDGAAHKNCHCGNDCRNQKGLSVLHRPFPFRRPMTGCGQDVLQQGILFLLRQCYGVECLLYFLFLHSKSPPNMVFSCFRARASRVRTVGWGQCRSPAISRVV